MFHHDTDEARINMPPRSTNHDLAFNTNDFVEMVWENNTLVMQQKIRPGCSSGGFFDNIIITENVNPRAVPDETDNYGKPSCSYYVNNNNKRSSIGDGRMIQIVENKKLKAKATDVVDQFTIQGDSLVPVHHDLNTTAGSMRRRKMEEESNDHLVPGPDMSIAASNDITAPPSQLIYQQHSHSSSSTYLETQQWSDEDEESRSRWNYYNRRNHRSSPSQKKRRDHRINRKMRALQVLLPNTTNKVVVDKACVLDEAIEYVKSLQLQLELMSTHMFPASPMMIPQIPMNAAMGLWGYAFPQMSCFPYMPFFGGAPSSLPVVQAETTSVDQIGSTPPPKSGSNHSTYPNDISQMGLK